MRRILVVCQHFWPENFRINDLCDWLSDQEVQVDVLCGEPNYPKGEWFEGYGAFKKRKDQYKKIKIHRSFEIKRGSNSNLRIFLNYISFPISSIFHVPSLMRTKYDKILIYSLSPVYMGIAGIIVGKLQHIEVVTYVMDLWPENLYSVLNFKNKLIRRFLYSTSTWYYKKSDKLIAISNKAVKILMDRTGKSPDKITFIPQCCEKIYEEKLYDEELFKRFGGQFNIVYAGNISPAQDFDIIVKAASVLKKDCRINWIIVGDGMSKSDAEKAVKNHGLEDIFFFEGFTQPTNIPKYFYIASGLIACLNGSALLDCTIPARVTSYIASGTPIILAMNGEAASIVNDGQCGFACCSGNLDSLVDNIRRLYNMSNEERAAMGKNAQKIHYEYFEHDMNYRKLYDFIFS